MEKEHRDPEENRGWLDLGFRLELLPVEPELCAGGRGNRSSGTVPVHRGLGVKREQKYGHAEYKLQYGKLLLKMSWFKCHLRKPPKIPIQRYT